MSENAYKQAGVDVEAGYESVRLIKDDVKKTAIEGVLGGIGGFGGLFEMPKNYENPVLVSGTDGVGTKIRVAFLMDKHDTIGQDCVAMCVNDIACSGAKPLFFLDYIAIGKNVPEKVAQIVKGVADGCVLSGCALVGGETAEHPGMMPEDEYDVAGFSVGVVEKSKITDGKNAKAGNVLIGIASSGVHSNGYSLVRKVFGLNDDNAKETLNTYSNELGKTIGEELLTPTRIYVKPLLKLIDEVGINTVSHITGGGFIENVPRMLPDGLKAVIKKGSWEVLPIFNLMQKKADIPERDMYNTFNMGIGMIVAVDADKAEKAVKCLEDAGEKAYIIGELVEGEAAAQVAGVLCLKGGSEGGVEAGRDVAGEHAGLAQAAAQGELAVDAGKLQNLGQGVLEEAAPHARGTHGANLLLVDQQADGGALDLLDVQLSYEARVGAGAVVLAVAQDHGAVKAQVAGGAGGNDLKLRGEKVLLVDAKLLLKYGQDPALDEVLILGLLALLDADGTAAHQDV